MRFSSYNSNTLFSLLESAQISCKNLLAAGHTSSGTYYLKVNGYSFQVSSLAFYLLKESLETHNRELKQRRRGRQRGRQKKQ